MRFISFSKRETGVLSTATFQIGNIIIPRQRQSVSIESRRTNISLEMIFKMEGWRARGGEEIIWRHGLLGDLWPGIITSDYFGSLQSPPRKAICCRYVVKHVIQSPLSIGILQTSVGASHPCVIALVVQVHLAYGGLWWPGSIWRRII